MDSKLGVQHGHHHHHNGGVSKPPVPHHHHGRRGGGRQHGGGGSGKQGIKVVYISSPMKLTASAEEFRAIVQELTGRDSNVADHDLAGAAPGAPSSSSSYSSYSFGSASPTAAAGAAAAAAGALPSTMMTATASSGSRLGPEYAAAGVAAPAAFQGSMYDQTSGSLLYGQGYW